MAITRHHLSQQSKHNRWQVGNWATSDWNLGLINDILTCGMVQGHDLGLDSTVPTILFGTAIKLLLDIPSRVDRPFSSPWSYEHLCLMDSLEQATGRVHMCMPFAYSRYCEEHHCMWHTDVRDSVHSSVCCGITLWYSSRGWHWVVHIQEEKHQVTG